MTQTEKITSRSNQRIKHARSVMRGEVREFVFLEGVRLIEEAVKSGVSLLEVFVADPHNDRRKASIISALDGASCSVWLISGGVANLMSDTPSPQGIFAIASRPRWTLGDLEDSWLVVYLHETNNPANLGAIVRVAEAAGVSGLVVSSGSSDPFAPKALRGSMGSALRMKIVEGIDLDDALTWAESKRLATTAADIGGTQPYFEVDWSKPRLLVFGSEAHGLDIEIKLGVNELITIPMRNGVESLNLAVSCGIILFEAAKHDLK
jgi:RNA methyltransferase, TrmH family